MVSEVGLKEDVAANMYLRHIYMRHSHTPSTKCRIFFTYFIKSFIRRQLRGPVLYITNRLKEPQLSEGIY